jgi:4-amino-4-deoxy-L-arabinose transferase-like glycosyltransferase
LTTFNSNPEVGLPKAGPATNDRPQGTSVSELSPQQQVILDYLLVNTDPESYLLATVSSHEAAPFILATSRPVLTFGGFTGSDEVIDVDQLAQMVSSGELRFVLGSSDQSSKPEIYAWVRQNCSLVDVPGATKVAANQNVAFGPGQGNATLYDCGI